MGFKKSSIKSIVSILFRESRIIFSSFLRDGLLTHASALTFSSITSFIPMLAIAYYSFSTLGGFEKVQPVMEEFLFSNIAPSFAERISEYIVGIRENISAKALGVFGIITFALSTIMTIAKIESTFNSIWGISKGRNWKQKFILYWTLMTVGPIFLGFSIYLSIAAARLINLGSEIAFVSMLMNYFSSLAVTAFLFTLLYWFLPNLKVSIKSALASGFIVAVLFELAKYLYSYYTATALGNSFYGSLSILPVFFLWIYVAWCLCLFGAELNYYIMYRSYGLELVKNAECYDEAILLELLERIHLENEKNDRQWIASEQLFRQIKWSPRELRRHIDYLLSRSLILEVKTNSRSELAYCPYIRDRNKNLSRLIRSFDGIQYSNSSSQWANEWKKSQETIVDRLS